jgi:hypothetical protein
MPQRIKGRPHDQQSIFRGIRYGNVSAIRRVMNAVCLQLAGNNKEDAQRVAFLDPLESDIVERIMDLAAIPEMKELAVEVATKFFSAQAQAPSAVLRAERNLDKVAHLMKILDGPAALKAANLAYRNLEKSDPIFLDDYHLDGNSSMPSNIGDEVEEVSNSPKSLN